MKTIQNDFYEVCSKGFQLSLKCRDYEDSVNNSVENLKEKFKQITEIVNERTFLINDTIKLSQIASQSYRIIEDIPAENEQFIGWLYDNFNNKTILS